MASGFAGYFLLSMVMYLPRCKDKQNPATYQIDSGVFYFSDLLNRVRDPLPLKQGLNPMNFGIVAVIMFHHTYPSRGEHLISRRRRTTNLRTARCRRECPWRGRISEIDSVADICPPTTTAEKSSETEKSTSEVEKTISEVGRTA